MNSVLSTVLSMLHEYTRMNDGFAVFETWRLEPTHTSTVFEAVPRVVLPDNSVALLV